MKPVLGILIASVVLLAPSRCTSQDINVRAEAVLLLERADAASSSPKLPNLERVDTFRVYDDAGTQEGSFSRVVIQGVGRRDEYSLGAYHLLNIWGKGQVAAAGTPKILPPELENLVHITPILLLRFDAEDVIHRISDRAIGNTVSRCIEFDTVRGQRADSNEICVDSGKGTIVLERLGQELIEYSDFFPFAGALLPGKINYSRNAGRQRMEVTQIMNELADTDANVLAPPPDAQIRKLCTTFRRPFGLSMPQPKPGNGGQTEDVVVRGLVGLDGKIDQATVQSSDREDLNPEALDIAKQWTFTPAMCNGHPDMRQVSIVLHFQGR